MEGEAPSTKEGRGPRRSNSFSGVVARFPGTSRTIFKGPWEDGEEEEENSVEEEGADGTEGATAPFEPSLLAIMQQMTQIIAHLQEASSSDSPRPPAFKTSSMKAPEFFDGTQCFKDPNEVRKAEAELDSLRLNKGGNVSFCIADFRSLVSRIGDWGERALIHHCRKGLPSRILDHLASHPSRVDSLQDLMNLTLELDSRYHERQNERGHHQEKKPEA
ncbi:hypothetical protein O181_128593 [Austropuccinia psidii MF-1]|uniref:Uncharacterized protein n=1 Tax=Austropuccinia psidii MF-1 TaxID=1389203 RepID=A0A9Q3KWL3_9BASI|nr:hypothetical protein [Austropuccinia psidii MF-1]